MYANSTGRWHVIRGPPTFPRASLRDWAHHLLRPTFLQLLEFTNFSLQDILLCLQRLYCCG